jgi:hypothetical protein
MPWTVADVDKHHKGLSDHQKKVWVAVANSVLSKTGDDASAIRQANGAANRVDEGLEAVLYAKAADMIESIRLQESANFWGDLQILAESDPKPRVEKDINGKPVVPSRAQFQQYFDGMAASHIETMLKSTRERWSKAASDKKTPELKAISNELAAGTAVLKSKRGAENTAKKKIDKKQRARYKAIHTSIKKFAGKNPFMHMIAKHVVDNFIGHPPAAKKRG